MTRARPRPGGVGVTKISGEQLDVYLFHDKSLLFCSSSSSLFNVPTPSPPNTTSHSFIQFMFEWLFLTLPVGVSAAGGGFMQDYGAAFIACLSVFIVGSIAVVLYLLFRGGARRKSKKPRVPVPGSKPLAALTSPSIQESPMSEYIVPYVAQKFNPRVSRVMKKQSNTSSSGQNTLCTVDTPCPSTFESPCAVPDGAVRPGVGATPVTLTPRKPSIGAKWRPPLPPTPRRESTSGAPFSNVWSPRAISEERRKSGSLATPRQDCTPVQLEAMAAIKQQPPPPPTASTT